jgi:Arc/MetJ-type ribon-helix-helix transcriptional regulator
MKGQRAEVVCRGLRVNKVLAKRIEEAVAKSGYQSASAFMRAAIEREIAGRESGVDEAEKRIAASLDRIARELRGIRIRQQAEFAFLDALVKTMLTHLTELPRDAYDQAVARGKVRYERFLKSVGMGMNGDSQAAITELMRRVEDE